MLLHLLVARKSLTIIELTNGEKVEIGPGMKLYLHNKLV